MSLLRLLPLVDLTFSVYSYREMIAAPKCFQSTLHHNNWVLENHLALKIFQFIQLQNANVDQLRRSLH